MPKGVVLWPWFYSNRKQTIHPDGNTRLCCIRAALPPFLLFLLLLLLLLVAFAEGIPFVRAGGDLPLVLGHAITDRLVDTRAGLALLRYGIVGRQILLVLFVAIQTNHSVISATVAVVV